VQLFKHFRFVGGRVVKTGIAVFLTALVCDLLDWPAMFAVITAIVTIEPTATDSIKKAYIRFPASAIGALYAAFIAHFLGDRPITYTLVALATIITCYKLHLTAGTLVATLTGVAMISTIQENYITDFFVRLGTTTLGLTISSVVNIFVLPPNYSTRIAKNINSLFVKTGNVLHRRGIEILQNKSLHKETKMIFKDIQRELEKTDTLCEYQKEEWKFHRSSRKDVRNFHYEYKKLNTLRQLLFHIGNLIYLPAQDYSFTEAEEKNILTAAQSMRGILHHPSFNMEDHHYVLMKKLLEEFWDDPQELNKQKFSNVRHHFTCETVLLYELLSIHDLLEELNQIHSLEMQREKVLEKSRSHQQ
jgi:uncharacterized membrane protein YgaE (UPF0421/DUF939 family)